MVANSLVNGLSWDDIELKLDNWTKDRRLTPKDESSKDPIESARRAREEKAKKFKLDFDADKEFEDESKEVGSDELGHEEDNKPALTFADKHPRLARVGNFFKGIRDRFIKKEKDETENTESKGPSSKEEKEEDKKERTEKSAYTFKDEIRYIAEYGEEVGRRKFLEDKFDRHSDGPKVKSGFSKVDATARQVRDYEDKGDEGR